MLLHIFKWELNAWSVVKAIGVPIFLTVCSALWNARGFASFFSLIYNRSFRSLRIHRPSKSSSLFWKAKRCILYNSLVRTAPGTSYITSLRESDVLFWPQGAWGTYRMCRHTCRWSIEFYWCFWLVWEIELENCLLKTFHCCGWREGSIRRPRLGSQHPCQVSQNSQ